MSIRPWVIVLAAVVLFSAGWLVNGWRHSAKLASVELAHSQLLEKQAYAVVASVEAARAEESRRTAAVENERDHAIEQSQSLEMDLAAGRTVSDRLRRELSALRARHASGNATAAERGQDEQDTDAIGLLIDMYAGLGAAGREVAEYADRLRIAGLTCERTYDAVR